MSTLFNIAKASASTTGKTHAETAPFAKAYAKADPAKQKEMRHEWREGFIAGSLGISREQAAKIVETGKGEGAKPANIKLIDRANSDFRYHVIRPNNKAGDDDVAIPAELRRAAKVLAKLAGEYKEGRRLAAKALALAWAE